MDHTSKGWICFNLYMHDGCVAGYVCDSVAGQCIQAAAGQGDTLTNCESTCTANPVTDTTYECDATTFTCVEATNKFDQKTCDASCADETPADLIGLWRGINVQTGFMMGEYVMNFTESTVAWGLVADPRMVVAKVSIISPSTLSLLVLEPASSAGNVIIATYTSPGWPTGPETTGMTIAIQADGSHQAPPQDARYAMGDVNFDVLSMLKCNSFGSAGCDFSRSFAESAERVELIAVQTREARALLAFEKALLGPGTTDSCTVYGDCDSCLNDASGVCGWCDGTVTDISGNVICGADGNGCCGGSDGFSYCNVAFRKTCPVICDYTDWLNPSCRAATSKEINSGTQTFEDCDSMPWCTSTVYQYCDETALQCKTVYTEADCNAAPDCDVANPICDSATCKTINYIYCDDVLGCQSTTDKEECDANPACDSSGKGTCDPTECVAQLFYTCDESSYKCTPHTGPFPPTPYYNTTADCTAACVNTDLTGVWRALRVDTTYIADEYDFAFTETAFKFVSRATGDSSSGTYVIGDAITGSSYPAAVITLTFASPGPVLKGIVSNDRSSSSAKGPVTKFIYIAFGSSPTSFDAGMASGNNEFVLMGCLNDGIEQGCDFTSASP